MAQESLYNGVLNKLGHAIVSGELPAGSRLVLSDIEERFEVSRTVARDVIKVLESLGLASSRRRAGIEILARSQWRVLDPVVLRWRLQADPLGQLASLTELREAVEPRAARLAAEKASDDEIAALVAHAERIDELAAQGLGLSDEFLAADVAFHVGLLEASGNEMLTAMGPAIEVVLLSRRDFRLSEARPRLEVIRQHRVIAQAIAGRLPDQAEAASRLQLGIVHQEIADIDRSGWV